MELRVFTVDAFTDQPFSGNPAAIIPLDNPLPEETLQKIAQEINLSETAYLTPMPPTTGSPTEVQDDHWTATNRFGLRWFTPTNEVILCGHATLAASHVLFHCLGNNSSHLEFETLSGTLRARRDHDAITLDFPNNCPVTLTPEQEGVFAPLVAVVREQLPVAEVMVSAPARKLLVRLDDGCTRQQLESFQPDNRRLVALHDGSVIKGLILTLKGHKSSPAAGSQDKGLASYHFVSRYFAEWNGIPEDPVTGSAHTVLGPYWARLLNSTTLNCRQVSPRGGDLTVVVREDGRVDLTGRAVTVLRGTIELGGCSSP